jgi:hypothetical protein
MYLLNVVDQIIPGVSYTTQDFVSYGLQIFLYSLCCYDRITNVVFYLVYQITIILSFINILSQTVFLITTQDSIPEDQQTTTMKSFFDMNLAAIGLTSGMTLSLLDFFRENLTGSFCLCLPQKARMQEEVTLNKE